MSDKIHSPSKDIKSFIPYRDKEDQRSNGNGNNSSADFESRNRTKKIVLNSSFHPNMEYSTEDEGKNRRQKTTVKYPTKKSRVLLAWKQDQVECTNILKQDIAKRSRIECADSNLFPASTIEHDQHENSGLKETYKAPPEFIYKSKDSGKEISCFNALDSDLAVSGLSHFTCYICNMVFDYKSLLEDHYKVHSVVNSLKCCNSKRQNSKQYKFKYQKAFSDSVDSSSYRKNCRSSSEDRQCKCNSFLKNFKEKENLTLHYRIQTGEKPYICKRCEKRFSYGHRFKRHIKICGVSWNIGKYECNICPKRYKNKKNLIIHNRIHTGEKPYCCKKCGMRFSASSNFWHHRKKCGSSSETL